MPRSAGSARRRPTRCCACSSISRRSWRSRSELGERAMLKYECPHCHKRTISFWRWEPFREYFRHYPDIPALPNPIVCPQCGGRATMPFWPAALWGALPLFALIVGHDFFGWGLFTWTLMVAAAVVGTLLQPEFTSLSKE